MAQYGQYGMAQCTAVRVYPCTAVRVHRSTTNSVKSGMATVRHDLGLRLDHAKHYLIDYVSIINLLMKWLIIDGCREPAYS